MGEIHVDPLTHRNESHVINKYFRYADVCERLWQSTTWFVVALVFTRGLLLVRSSRVAHWCDSSVLIKQRHRYKCSWLHQKSCPRRDAGLSRRW
jgi:hypothetical protein